MEGWVAEAPENAILDSSTIVAASSCLNAPPRKSRGNSTLPYLRRLNRLIGAEQFHVELGRVYRLEDAAIAHRELEKHHLGKLAFRVHPSGHVPQ